MSAVIPITQINSSFQNLITSNSVGIINLVSGLPSPPNGYVITDLVFTPFNYSISAAGNLLFSGAFGMINGALTPGLFIPIQSFNIEVIAAPVGVNVFPVQPLARNFGSGLIVPQGYVLAFRTLSQSANVSSINFTLDLTGFLV